MLKAGIKRRRTQRQITDERAEEILKQQAIEDKLAKFEELQSQLAEAKKEAENGKAATNILTDMINNGQAQVDENGNVSVMSQVVGESEMSQSSQQPHQKQQNENSQGFQI